MAITAAAVLKPVVPASPEEKAVNTLSGGARTVIQCSLRLSDGAAVLSSATADSLGPMSPHASCSISAFLNPITNRHPRPATPVSSHPFSAAHRPKPSHSRAAANCLLHGPLAAQQPRKGHRGQPRQPRHGAKVAAVAATDRERLGFLTDPARLDASLQLGVVDTAAGCQLPVAFNASPIPRPQHQARRSHQASFALFHAHAPKEDVGLRTLRQDAAPVASAERLSSLALHPSYSAGATAIINGLRTRPADTASHQASRAAALASQPAAASVRASQSIYAVTWEVAASGCHSAMAEPAVGLPPMPQPVIEVQTGARSVKLQSHKRTSGVPR